MIEIKLKQKLGTLFLDVEESLPSSGITAIFGRSGSGKTSLINAIAGISTPENGVIRVNGHTLYDQANRVNLAIEKRNIGYVFQDARLFPHYSVRGNLLYGAKEGVAEEAFQHILSLLNLSHLLERFPVDLSGGEKQRVAIARALLSQPDMLLMDEPLASLDLPRKKEVMPFLEKLALEIEIPILYVTHSLSEILRLADHIVILDEGRVKASGDLESVWGSEVMRPWQSFAKQSSVFEATIQQHHETYALTKVALNSGTHLWVQHIEEIIGKPIRLQIRANDVSVTLKRPEQTSIRNVLSATIASIENVVTKQGNQNVSLNLDLGEQTYLKANITLWALDELKLSVGQIVYVQIKGVSVTQKDMAMKHFIAKE